MVLVVVVVVLVVVVVPPPPPPPPVQVVPLRAKLPGTGLVVPLLVPWNPKPVLAPPGRAAL